MVFEFQLQDIYGITHKGCVQSSQRFRAGTCIQSNLPGEFSKFPPLFGLLLSDLLSMAQRLKCPPGSGRFPGEGNGNPLQYSCLENPMEGGAWQATVHGVAKRRTRLSDFTFIFTLLSRRKKEMLNMLQTWQMGSHIRIGKRKIVQ